MPSFLLQAWFISIIVSSKIAQGLVCYTCQNIPHPRDCGRIVECAAGEECFVEKIVTTAGNILYNSGCASSLRCGERQSTREIHANNMTSLVTSHNSYVQKRDDLVFCYGCCNSSNYCNRDVCDGSVPSVSFDNRTSCLNCPNAAMPDKCEFTSLCDVNEVCYTELVRINGEDRYRLGCVDPDACLMMDAPAQSAVLVGRKRFLVNLQPRFSDYCGKCCDDRVSNCNRDLCRQGANGKPGTIGILKNPPPQQICEDIDTQSCLKQIQNDPDSCLNVTIANYACRRTCRGCSTGSSLPGTGIVENLPMTDCFYKSSKYQGAHRTSISGSTCIPWSLVYSKVPAGPGLPEGGVRDAENKCRDPTGKGHPWCYINEVRWEYCNVPYCEECYYQGNEKQFSGYTSTTSDNATCLPWVNYHGPIPLDSSSFPDGSKRNASNYCRDPFESGVNSASVGIVCYTKGGFKTCGLKQCPGSCVDDANTNCPLIKMFVCAREYSGRTLCPKTCGYCSHGLLPAKYIDPPTQKCEDVPTANCPTIKDIICQNATAARLLCPKTCNVGCGTQVNPVTSTPSTLVTWSRWGQWECSVANGQCYQVRYRSCSSGRESDCQGRHTDILPCDQVNCHDNSTIKTTATTIPTTKATTTLPTTPIILDPCHDNLTCSGLNLAGLACNEAVLSAYLCPKTCDYCGGPSKCKDVFECYRPGVRNYFCSDDKMAVKFCRKSCQKCSQPFERISLNSCGDPVSEGECALLNKELCICHDPDIKMLCRHYCEGTCQEAFQDYTYCPAVVGQRSAARSQRIQDMLRRVRFA